MITSAPAATLRALGRRQVEDLCSALRLTDQVGSALSTFEVLSETWADRTLDRPTYSSDITDDSSPYEFSVAFEEGSPELRMLVEAQGPQDGARARWDAGWRLTEELGVKCGASLDRARIVAPLFEPEMDGLVFSLWHASSSKGGTPSFRTYFNPQAHGTARAVPVIFEALTKLGMGGAGKWLIWYYFRELRDRPIYFSVDLAGGPKARAKIYFAHPGTTAQTLDALVTGLAGHQEGQCRSFCRAMTGSDGPYTSRPPITCVAFTAGSDLPYTITVHIPIRCYAANDRVALERICEQLAPDESILYRDAVLALARRSLDTGSGIQTYASYRREAGRRRLTVYLSPEVYSTGGALSA